MMLFLLCCGVCQAAAAAEVPRCWIADQPGQEIQDGIFRVFVPTQDNSAIAVAKALAIASYSLANKTAVGASDDLSQIEIDLFGNTQYWEPTTAFPTLQSYKNAILVTIQPLLSLPGATIECAPVSHRHPPN